MKNLVAVLELIAIFALETVLWVFGVKPSDIEMDDEYESRLLL